MKFLIQTLIFLLTLVGTVQAQDLPKKTDKYGITMIKLPAGSFMMGDNSCKQVPAMCNDPFDRSKKSRCSKKQCSGRKSEHPVHKVSLNSFWISQTETTQMQYYKVMRTNPSQFTSDKLGYRSENNPVEKVTWFEAKEFCEKLGYRLPTEAEWEYAVRAGSSGNYYGLPHEIAWFDSNSNNQTQPVGRKLPNKFGLYDMSGNVWEWVNDWNGEHYYKVSPRRNPKGVKKGTYRVLRGGSIFLGKGFLRMSYRSNDGPNERGYYGYGFRCAQ